MDDNYGIIMIPKPPPRTTSGPRRRPGLGFALKLAEEERFEGPLSVTAYRSGAPQGSRPTTSSGKCVNPIVNRNQLEYLVETEAGVSGCPVWLGYKRYPTVVAIQCVRTNHPISLPPSLYAQKCQTKVTKLTLTPSQHPQSPNPKTQQRQHRNPPHPPRSLRNIPLARYFPSSHNTTSNRPKASPSALPHLVSRRPNPQSSSRR